MSTTKRLQLAERGTWLSIITYCFLATIKLIIGALFTSAALQADGLNNATDILSSCALLIGLKISQRPASSNYQYGYLRAETLASFIAAILMLMIGVEVFTNLFHRLHLKTAVPSIEAAYVSLGCMFIMLFVYMYNRRLAKRLQNETLRVAALDNRNDAIISLGAAISIFCASYRFVWLDLLAALIISLIIIKTAITLLLETSTTLMDRFQATNIQHIYAQLQPIPGIQAISEIKGRAHGSTSFLEITAEVSPTLTVAQSEAIVQAIQEKLDAQYMLSIKIKPHVPQ